MDSNVKSSSGKKNYLWYASSVLIFAMLAAGEFVPQLELGKKLALAGLVIGLTFWMPYVIWYVRKIEASTEPPPAPPKSYLLGVYFLLTPGVVLGVMGWIAFNLNYALGMSVLYIVLFVVQGELFLKSK